ncbi:flagellar hook-basal body complex protein [Castellaniella sp.]|uniref:flagellar hook-basal body complex protein n=1 Tax=Castellaniella sp. TaxID=1955812 RepID=UPI003C732BAD
MGFGQGLSGLNAASQNLDVIGNNIANSGTVGFKTGTATFADVYASSRVGLGVQVASINQRFTTGIVSTSGNQFDMAIDGAKGLFVVTQPNGATLYTRNGQFLADKDHFIVNAQGQRLMGYAPGGTNLIPMTVPIGNIAPQATSTITNKVNLDANAKVVPPTAEVLAKVVLTQGGTDTTYYYRPVSNDWYSDAAGTTVSVPPDGAYTTGTPAVAVNIATSVPDVIIPSTGSNVAYAPATAPIAFDPANPDSFSKMVPLTVFDSLGNEHRVEQYYTKREPVGGESVWEVNYVVDGNVDPANKAILTFDSAGRLASSTPNPPMINFTPGGATSPADPVAIQVAYAGSTQFGGSYSQDFVQNGYATGEYASMSIGTNGELVANYTNGAKQVMGQLALADFANLQGLQPVGGNAWAETANSGQPIMGTPGSNGLATIKGQAVEESNVDMSQELVNMIIAQRTYQANAQTIKTQDQILQTLITMR